MNPCNTSGPYNGVILLYLRFLFVYLIQKSIKYFYYFTESYALFSFWAEYLILYTQIKLKYLGCSSAIEQSQKCVTEPIALSGYHIPINTPNEAQQRQWFVVICQWGEFSKRSLRCGSVFRVQLQIMYRSNYNVGQRRQTLYRSRMKNECLFRCHVMNKNTMIRHNFLKYHPAI